MNTNVHLVVVVVVLSPIYQSIWPRIAHFHLVVVVDGGGETKRKSFFQLERTSVVVCQQADSWNDVINNYQAALSLSW